MNLHEIPAFAQNFSIKFTCCVPEPVIMLYVLLLSQKVKKNPVKIIFKKLHFSLLFFFFRMSRPSGNLVIATELLIA